MLKFEHLEVGPLSVNCSIAWEEDTKSALVIDPGDEAKLIESRLLKLDLEVKAILLTHAHFDHFGAASYFQGKWNCPCYLHPSDLPLLNSVDTQTSIYGLKPIKKPVTEELAHDQVIHFLKVIHTPGHSPGGCCFFGLFESGPTLFAGDTLFQGGVGRTDLFGGCWEDLEQSIAKKLYVLDKSTFVVPGHGPCTTIKAETSNNRFVRATI